MKSVSSQGPSKYGKSVKQGKDYIQVSNVSKVKSILSLILTVILSVTVMPTAELVNFRNWL